LQIRETIRRPAVTRAAQLLNFPDNALVVTLVNAASAPVAKQFS
jgi:hypothetical protein